MYRRLTSTFILTLTCCTLVVLIQPALARPALADGVIIVDPPPPLDLQPGISDVPFSDPVFAPVLKQEPIAWERIGQRAPFPDPCRQGPVEEPGLVRTHEQGENLRGQDHECAPVVSGMNGEMVEHRSLICQGEGKLPDG